MKKERQQALINIISSEDIGTQELLMSKMLELGYKLTQATISRDIAELNIHKVRTSNGDYKYVSGSSNDKFKTMLASTIQTVSSARNIVVIKCHSGMANAACAVFDNEELNGVIGTLSGDDTFIAITDSDETAKQIENSIKGIIKQ